MTLRTITHFTSLTLQILILSLAMALAGTILALKYPASEPWMALGIGLLAGWGLPHKSMPHPASAFIITGLCTLLTLLIIKTLLVTLSLAVVFGYPYTYTLSQAGMALIATLVSMSIHVVFIITALVGICIGALLATVRVVNERKKQNFSFK